MKLYYSPGACSLAPHIVAHELGIPLTLEKVDTKTKQTASGADFTAINPKGYVPALELDNGELLTEGPVISQYLADLKPKSGLAPPNGTLARYRLQEMLGYINSEIHKSFSPLFNSATSPELRQDRIDYLRKRFGLVDRILANSPWITGDTFTVADAYLFTVSSWADYVKFDISEFTALQDFRQRAAQRPAVQAALKAEGLAK